MIELTNDATIPLFGDFRWTVWNEDEEDAQGIPRKRYANIFNRYERTKKRKRFTKIDYNKTIGCLTFSFPTYNIV
jgi:hypothetical protein